MGEHLRGFGGAPGSASESFEIVTDHGTGVVEAKERVKAHFFEFSLSDDGSPLAFKGSMGGERKALPNCLGVVGIFIRFDLGSRMNEAFYPFKEFLACPGSIVGPGSVLF